VLSESSVRSRRCSSQRRSTDAREASRPPEPVVDLAPAPVLRAHIDHHAVRLLRFLLAAVPNGIERPCEVLDPRDLDPAQGEQLSHDRLVAAVRRRRGELRLRAEVDRCFDGEQPTRRATLISFVPPVTGSKDGTPSRRRAPR
jgi:hypothetical protein